MRAAALLRIFRADTPVQGLRAIGLGALDTFTSNTVTRWFVKRRGMALAAMTIGFYLGTDLLTLQLVAAVTRAASWRWALRAAAATCAAAAPACAALLRSTPEQAGLLPDGKAVASDADLAVSADAASPALAGPELTRRQALRVSAFWVWGAFTLVYFFAASGTDFHLKEMVRESGTVDVASSLSIATGIASALSCALVGVLVRPQMHGMRAHFVMRALDTAECSACIFYPRRWIAARQGRASLRGAAFCSHCTSSC